MVGKQVLSRANRILIEGACQNFITVIDLVKLVIRGTWLDSTSEIPASAQWCSLVGWEGGLGDVIG